VRSVLPGPAAVAQRGAWRGRASALCSTRAAAQAAPEADPCAGRQLSSPRAPAASQPGRPTRRLAHLLRVHALVVRAVHHLVPVVLLQNLCSGQRQALRQAGIPSAPRCSAWAPPAGEPSLAPARLPAQRRGRSGRAAAACRPWPWRGQPLALGSLQMDSMNRYWKRPWNWLACAWRRRQGRRLPALSRRSAQPAPGLLARSWAWQLRARPQPRHTPGRARPPGTGAAPRWCWWRRRWPPAQQQSFAGDQPRGWRDAHPYSSTTTANSQPVSTDVANTAECRLTATNLPLLAAQVPHHVLHCGQQRLVPRLHASRVVPARTKAGGGVVARRGARQWLLQAAPPLALRPLAAATRCRRPPPAGSSPPPPAPSPQPPAPSPQPPAAHLSKKLASCSCSVASFCTRL
jgi:hypothetical protein